MFDNSIMLIQENKKARKEDTTRILLLCHSSDLHYTVAMDANYNLAGAGSKN